MFGHFFVEAGTVVWYSDDAPSWPCVVFVPAWGCGCFCCSFVVLAREELGIQRLVSNKERVGDPSRRSDDYGALSSHRQDRPNNEARRR